MKEIVRLENLGDNEAAGIVRLENLGDNEAAGIVRLENLGDNEAAGIVRLKGSDSQSGRRRLRSKKIVSSLRVKVVVRHGRDSEWRS